MSFLHTVAAFVVALGILIVVHEYGHYLAARLCGIKVLRFSVGFGKPIATWRQGRDGTEWTLAAVPFGGYVKMLDEREGFVAAEDMPRAFNRQNVWKRFLVVVAGPVFNFVFAVLVYAVLFMHGMPEVRPVIAQPSTGTLAAQAGFRAEETLRAIDGKAVRTWGEVRWRVLEAALQHEVLSVEVIDEHQHMSMLTLDLRAVTDNEVEGDLLARLGLQLFRPTLEPVLGRLVAGSPAERAGLAPGDRITRVDGVPVETWEGLVRVIRASPDRVLKLDVLRAGATLRLEVRPEAVKSNGEKFGRIGAAPYVSASHADRMLVRVHYGPLESLLKAAGKTYDIAVFSLKMIGKMLLGEVSWRHLSGPVTIADFAGQSAQMGWIPYVNFLALISISLGVLNLLPIPLLDGGHLMYYTVEIIKGSPVSDRAMELGQRVGLTLLLVMMAFAFYNDLNRLLSG
jgi:regulator of sigma E protease